MLGDRRPGRSSAPLPRTRSERRRERGCARRRSRPGSVLVPSAGAGSRSRGPAWSGSRGGSARGNSRRRRTGRPRGSRRRRRRAWPPSATGSRSRGAPASGTAWERRCRTIDLPGSRRRRTRSAPAGRRERRRSPEAAPRPPAPVSPSQNIRTTRPRSSSGFATHGAPDASDDAGAGNVGQRHGLARRERLGWRPPCAPVRPARLPPARPSGSRTSTSASRRPSGSSKSCCAEAADAHAAPAVSKATVFMAPESSPRGPAWQAEAAAAKNRGRRGPL